MYDIDRPIEPGSITMANEEHLAILRQGVEAWNEWRKANPDVRPDLTLTNLSEANLFKANLSEADLQNTHLVKADLRGANLTKADLGGVLLREANLSNADLSE